VFVRAPPHPAAERLEFRSALAKQIDPQKGDPAQINLK
jgi:hypothetical protein